MRDTVLHRYLRIPYRLHVRVARQVKKPQATLLFLHGIGSSGAEWRDVIDRLPDSVSILSIDLLGFGESPRPEWAKYSAHEQARSIVATLLTFAPKQQLVIVGHSLGALVAVEIATRYPLLVRSLVLCSPPFYNPDRDGRLPNADRVLQTLFSQVELREEDFVKLSRLATRYKLVNKAFNVTADNVASYIATLKSSIMSQTAFDDVRYIDKPITIIYGSLDPLVIDRNLKTIAKANSRVTLARILVGHEIMGRYVPAVVREIMKQISH
ncbi:MAG: alpha/beta fold hydrolase [Candidatus Saccharimonadales bacterium]